ncbi:MAG: hypothetical protein ABWY36_05450, partial [Leifsonia sp.]
DGELFRTLDDAAAALEARHRSGHWQESPVLRANGIVQDVLFPTVTNEAYILLWALIPEDQLTPRQLADDYFESREPHIDPGYYFPDMADRVVWIGARQGVRVGTLEQFHEQCRRRSAQDVREAGSVVVTDA